VRCCLRSGNYMSRIGKQILIIPEKVTVEKTGDVVTVKGPLGTLTRSFLPDVAINIEEGTVTFAPLKETKFARSLWGTYAAHIKNMIEGVVTPFQKKLLIEGVGYKMEVSGNKLVLSVGFSHKVNLDVPEGVTATLEKSTLTLSGINKEVVGGFAAVIRSWKKPEPYKGKGIRYDKEVVRRKEGKKAA